MNIFWHMFDGFPGITRAHISNPKHRLINRVARSVLRHKRNFPNIYIYSFPEII